jgi:hypothetical protein
VGECARVRFRLWGSWPLGKVRGVASGFPVIEILLMQAAN